VVVPFAHRQGASDTEPIRSAVINHLHRRITCEDTVKLQAPQHRRLLLEHVQASKATLGSSITQSSCLRYVPLHHFQRDASTAGLSTELILCIASFLGRTDLLSVSVTCKHLREATEPKLYREYINLRLYGSPIIKFVKRILQKPELAKYVMRLDLKDWDTLANLVLSGMNLRQPMIFRM
jgi:hypothetical protein